MTTGTAVGNRAHFIGIFVIAMAVLAYQVLLTRIFSVMLYYHFAFLGISLAMLGLTVGAQRVYFNKTRFSSERLEEEWAKAALLFSISSIGLVLWFLYSPLIAGDSTFTVLAFSLPLFTLPFIYSGICVTLILTKSPAATGKLYAADLLGAGLGCVGIVGILFFLDPVCIIFGLASLSAFTAWLMVRRINVRLGTQSLACAGILLLACLLQGGLYLSNHACLGVIWAKSGTQHNSLFERWNAISRVRVRQWPSTIPFGWGFGHPQKGSIKQLYLDIDADAGTIISHFDGDLKPFSFLANDIINIGYQIRPVKDVVVIGVGGGRDIMSALYFGVHKVTGLELNPAMLEVLTRKFADFTGYFYKRPDVTLINTEARSWLNQSHQSFDLVQISLIDTWAATAAGGLTLSENKLYTVEAWREFLSRLNPKGMLVVSRWFDSEQHKGEFYRLLSIAAVALEEQGVPREQVKQHILAFNVQKIVTVVISPTGFSGAEVEHIRQVAKDKGFTLMMAPDSVWDKTSGIIATGAADKAFYKSLPLDLTAPRDNRPFFFLTMRFKDMLFSGKKVAGGDMDIRNNVAVFIVIFLVGALFLITLAFVIEPLLKLSRDVVLEKRELLYFAGIGLGFMLIEISQMQRLMVFLGHPIYGLSVVLFTLLVFGGIGSFTVSPGSGLRQPWLRPVMLCLVLCIIGLITEPVTEALKIYGTAIRILASVALLAPAGFFMGMMFPLGMSMSAHHKALQPWFWSVNGATSVFASVLGVAISMQYGIATAYWCGVACYALCILCTLTNQKAPA